MKEVSSCYDSILSSCTNILKSWHPHGRFDIRRAALHGKADPEFVSTVVDQPFRVIPFRLKYLSESEFVQSNAPHAITACATAYGIVYAKSYISVRTDASFNWL